MAITSTLFTAGIFGWGGRRLSLDVGNTHIESTYQLRPTPSLLVGVIFGGGVCLDVSNIPIRKNPKESGPQIPFILPFFRQESLGVLFSLVVNVTPTPTLFV